jgi:DNA polymerase-3 subunit epsilon
MSRTWPWTRWRERRQHADGPYAALFAEPPAGEWVAIDLETTGLDPARDEILALAAIPGRGRVLQLRQRIDLVVRSDSPRILDAIRHHRLRPVDVAEGVNLQEALDRLLQLAGSRPLVGYCVGFDIAMLNRALRPQLGFGLPNQAIDVQREYAHWCQRRQPGMSPDLRFEAIAKALNLPTPDRHSAFGDALVAGLMHIRLQVERGR